MKKLIYWALFSSIPVIISCYGYYCHCLDDVSVSTSVAKDKVAEAILTRPNVEYMNYNKEVKNEN